MNKDNNDNATGSESVFLRPVQAAKLVAISRRHLDALTRAGKIPCLKISHKVVLYSREQLIKAIARLAMG